MEKPKTVIQHYYELARKCFTEELTFEQYKENYKLFNDGIPLLKEELKKKKVPYLQMIYQNLHSYVDKSKRKSQLIDGIVDAIKSCFHLDKIVSYVMGEDTSETAGQKIIDGMTEEYLKSFYDKRRAEKEAYEKSISNPETITEFNNYVSHHGKDSLTPEQSKRYDQLLSDRIIEARKKNEETKAIVLKQENISNEDFELHETKHSKTGEDIFTVRMVNRVDKETFKDLKIKARMFDGYYSRYTDKHASPPIYSGFNFSTEENALSFMGLAEGDQSSSDAQEQKKEKKVETTAEKMRARGQALIEKAEVDLSAERRTNTHRQAAQAANSIAKAEYEKTFGQKLIKIADGLEDGSIKYLSKLNNGKQLEQLQGILRRGYESRTTWADREKGIVQRDIDLDIEHVKFPQPVYYASTLKDILLKYSDTSGMKLDVKRALDYANRHSDENGKFVLTEEYTIKLFKRIASKIPDKWDKERISNQIKDLERIQNMGLTNLPLLKTALRELNDLSKGTGLSEQEKKEKKQKEIERSFIGKKIEGFFPTPPALIEKMFSMVKVFEGETILEPEAGLGHIADAIKEKYPDNKLSLIEFNYNLYEALLSKGYDDVEHMNFLSSTHKYDVIFMNPPFEKHQDIDHVRHAFNLLKPGGRLVSVMVGNKHENSGSKTVRSFLDFVEENIGYFNENEPGAFKSAFRSTGVATTMVYLEKENSDKLAENSTNQVTNESQEDPEVTLFHQTGRIF